MVTFEVRKQSHGPVVDVVERAIHEMSGWAWVNYLGRRYQIFGGVRGPYFIDLSNPL